MWHQNNFNCVQERLGIIVGEGVLRRKGKTFHGVCNARR